MKYISFLLLFVLSVLFSVRSLAQEPAQDTFSETLEVQAVNVEVVVTDKKGNRIEGLTAADFRLLVDGKEIPMEYFAEIREGQAVAPPVPETETAESQVPEVPGPPDLQKGEEVGNSYLVFIDEYFSGTQLRDEALKGILREASLLRPQDRMAIVAYSGRRIKVLSPWTNGGPQLERLLEELIRKNGLLADGSFDLGELDGSADRLLELYSRNLGRAYESEAASAFAEANRGMFAPKEIKKAVAAASASLRSFAAVPGRKIMLLLSGGWPYDMNMIIGGDWDLLKASITTRNDGPELLQPLIDTANLLGFTVYPIHLSHGIGYLPDAGSSGPPQSGSVGVMTAFVSQSSLLVTSAETGGKVLTLGRNRHLSKVMEDTSSYYWLGFTHTGDDRRRDLKVEVLRPEARVRSRSSFVPLSRRARVAMEVESALMTGEAPGMGALGVSIGKLRKTGLSRAELPFTVRVPADQITLIEQDGKYVGQLELRIGALDQDGARSEIPVMEISISQTQPPKPGMFIRYDATLQLRPASQDLQFVLYDLLSGKGFAERVLVSP